MPSKLFRGRPEYRVSRQQNRLALQVVILLAVVKLILEAATYLNVIIGRDSDIAPVEQRMNVLPMQKPISWAVASALSIGSDVTSV